MLDGGGGRKKQFFFPMLFSLSGEKHQDFLQDTSLEKKFY